MDGWGCQQPLHPFESLRAGEGAYGAAWVAGWAPSSANPAQATIWLLTLILTPLCLQPVSHPLWPCQSLPHRSFSTPGPLSTFEACLSPELGGCEPDQGVWDFTSVPRAGSREPTPTGSGLQLLRGPLLGVSAAGWASPPALQSSCHTCQEPECQCFLLPGLGLGPLALLRDPGRGDSTVSRRSRRFSGRQWLGWQLWAKDCL